VTLLFPCCTYNLTVVIKVIEFNNLYPRLNLVIVNQHSTCNKNMSSAVAEMGDRGHNRYGPKRGDAVPLSRGGGAGSPSNTLWPGPRSTSVPSTILIWSVQPFGHNRHGAKIGGLPFWGRGARSPSIRMPLRLRPISVPSGILIHQVVWPQQIAALWAKNRGPLLGEGSWVPIQHNGQGRGLPPCQFRLDPSNRLATIYQRLRRGQTDKGLIA